ncbi:chlorite dismutase family protein [Amycolatopsis sp. FDAARGOS 1241]|uniref:chlorite dismutase family protein n=1 Tax=Amycolatopsis sp. FDAARGOS 1241 TaxID=2778070 RepID=UPI00194FE50D|nr:chlorite dismutase family protein [Amycolatopsis sp. FDAARGOS 1241]QRP49195.1 chlorite dismutase family protein [Amycolatopsis sp. FDAARGOS 1241]
MSAVTLDPGLARTMWPVFKAGSQTTWDDRPAIAHELEQALTNSADGATIRGACLVLEGMRADADWVVWWHGDPADALQAAHLAVRKTSCTGAWRPVRSSAGLGIPVRTGKRVPIHPLLCPMAPPPRRHK